jgi:uncharacterized membrane protein YdfJ with MMPL/SSD domain
MKQARFGMAAAILIDATIVRAVLLPSAMKLPGDRNRYLPSGLKRFPRCARDRCAAAVPVPHPASW